MSNAHWRTAHGGAFTAGILLSLWLGTAAVPTDGITLSVDAATGRRPIDQRIYGMSYAPAASVAELRVTVNRWGGNATSRYNWQDNATNRAADWFFESVPDGGANPGESADTFISDTKRHGGEPIITVPTLDWVAKAGPNRTKLASFSISKYGPQTSADFQWFGDAGNGVSTTTRQPITGNDPRDAHVASDPHAQQKWVRHLIDRWGRAASGGVRYYSLDNEPSLWHVTHRDVHPTPATMNEVLDRVTRYAEMIKDVDPGAVIMAPEEWGWLGYRYSGYDQQWGSRLHWLFLPDRLQHGGRDMLPWLLEQLRLREQNTGRRIVDMLTVHFYPSGGEYGDDVSPPMQRLRSRSTRTLWDASYVDESWIRERVELIPRLRRWVTEAYPGTQIGITEYNWGASGHISGATAQADVLGIFGREGLDLATYWVNPPSGSPTYNAFRMYRNYDGRGSAFGETSVFAASSVPDRISVFGALRKNDGALTIIAISKQEGTASVPVTIKVAHFSGAAAQAWQLAAGTGISRVKDPKWDGETLSTNVPAQSVTMFVLAAPSAQTARP